MTMPTGDGTEGVTPSGGGDSATEQQQTGTEVTESNGEGDTPVSRADLAKEIDKWKALSRKNEQRARDNSAAAKKLADFENANKSELQKAQDQAAQYQAEAANARAEKFRLTAAASHGLSSDFIDYLGAGEESEINERAESLSKQIQAQVDAQLQAELAKYGITPSNGPAGTAPSAAGAASLSLGRRPVESLRPGSAPANDAPANKNDAFRQMLGR